MADVRLYISRHGKTMFNTIGRVQGWCDTPLTKVGEEGIRELGLGLKDAGLDFKLAVSSDLGRTVQTMTIAQRELGILGKIPYYQDKRIREWCFGSFEGMYDALVVSHGMTIATLAHLLEPERGANVFLDNGSITVLKYENGKLLIEAVGDLSYRKRGAELIAQGK
ncbi:histidine phosphatase family protein [Streptococcus suis]|uniref:histidine phosphatase family protein n=1 Tax=Streptococcus suis TaxID=1307 RepID=UPI002EA13503|nr:histidine phosphatase family protein [Streptococcus suis]MEE3733316.1 histidine phosphatase family protein [Streptococcus suis]